MFEKPQYLTPDGYRRLPKRPSKRNTKALTAKQAKTDVTAARTRLKKATAKGVQISPEAAKLIATALKAMLSQK